MSSTRQGAPGATRTCPHCRATVLESAIVCPGCRHHLRFGAAAADAAEPTAVPLHVEGTIRHPAGGPPWEYTMLLTIRNERGEEVARQVVGVGAIGADEARTFTLAVEIHGGTPERGIA